MNRPLVRTQVLNFVLFQAGWFVCVLGAASGRPGLGAGLGLVLVFAHLVLVPDRGREAGLLLFALALGLAVDSFHARTGVLVFMSGGLNPGLAPCWLLVLWMQLASILRFSLSWLAGRYALAGVLGALAGAGAYAAGVRLGAAGFGLDMAPALIRIGAGWGLALPLLLFAARKNGGQGGTYRIFR